MFLFCAEKNWLLIFPFKPIYQIVYLHNIFGWPASRSMLILKHLMPLKPACCVRELKVCRSNTWSQYLGVNGRNLSFLPSSFQYNCASVLVGYFSLSSSSRTEFCPKGHSLIAYTTTHKNVIASSCQDIVFLLPLETLEELPCHLHILIMRFVCVPHLSTLSVPSSA